MATFATQSMTAEWLLALRAPRSKERHGPSNMNLSADRCYKSSASKLAGRVGRQSPCPRQVARRWLEHCFEGGVDRLTGFSLLFFLFLLLGTGTYSAPTIQIPVLSEKKTVNSMRTGGRIVARLQTVPIKTARRQIGCRHREIKMQDTVSSTPWAWQGRTRRRRS